MISPVAARSTQSGPSPAPAGAAAASSSAPAVPGSPDAIALGPGEAQLLETARAGRPVLALARTGARADVGLWFRARPVWIAVFPDGIALLASGPRPFLQTASGAQLSTSFYSHLSGELVCVPAPELEIRSLPMGPALGWRLLNLIRAACAAAGPSLAPGVA